MLITFADDLTAALDQYGVTCKLFANDLKLYRSVIDKCDITKLWQLSITSLHIATNVHFQCRLSSL